jgi:hypothetical protein
VAAHDSQPVCALLEEKLNYIDLVAMGPDAVSEVKIINA